MVFWALIAMAAGGASLYFNAILFGEIERLERRIEVLESEDE